MSKVHEKFALQKIKTKLTHIVIKSYTLPTISNHSNFIMQLVECQFFAGENSNLRIFSKALYSMGF